MGVDPDVRAAIGVVLCPRWPLGRDGLDLADGGPLLHPGGFCVFRATLPAALDGLSDLRRARGETGWPYICSDFERGAGQQIDGMTRLPPALALGAADDEALAFEAGRNTGLEALTAGVQFVFAPVLDVANEPRNPIVATRAFAADPATVARMANAWIRGCQSTGAIATGKHYPGHGATTEDSHLELPVLRRSEPELAAFEEVPFAATIAAGVGAMMIGHLHVPSIETEADAPASLSRAVIHERLRRRLGFDGLVFTDALDMGAIARPTGDDPGAEPAVRCLNAGSDVALLPDDPARAARNMLLAVQRGILPRERLLEAAARIRAAVARVPARRLPARTAEADGADLALRIARASVTVAPGTTPQRIVLRRNEDIECACIDDGDAAASLPHLIDRMLAFGLRVRSVAAPSGKLPCLIAIFSDVRAWKGRVLLDPERATRLSTWLRTTGTRAVLASIGCPQAALPYAASAPCVFVYDSDEASLTALAEVLSGRSVPHGKPVFVPS
ncbi:MAG: hypothetical protein IPH13_06170 [Planctomycetes bacterium]|nr:hypothetical protein [Planctomycetota bacterium]MCC7172505.1 hypothetical protein [Planctomycetota bacterium]